MENKAEALQEKLPEVCVSCGTKMKGNYCRKCGEKKIVPERDFSIFKFLKQSMWHFVHFDSKLLRSCWLLVSKPGFLTAEWIAGRRVAYMKPLQMFVVAGLLFYFFLPTATAYFTSYRDLARGYQEQDFLMNSFHYDFGRALAEKAVRLHVDEETLKSDVIARASHLSKTWLFIIIPFWGTIIFLFFRQKMPWLAPHLIFAMHGLTFYILLDLGIHAVLGLLGLVNIGRYIFILLMTGFPIYQAIALRRIYGSPWPEIIVKTVGIASGFVALLLLYRQGMTICALQTIESLKI